ncbi:MAG: hypothetical protein KDK65_02920 [Chlamydiia bacterium]|nr:hypothetical protein [Chlamydiia bacterium]
MRQTLWIVSLTVIGTHLFFIGYFYHHLLPQPFKQIPPQKIAIQTIALQPRPQETIRPTTSEKKQEASTFKKTEKPSTTIQKQPPVPKESQAQQAKRKLASVSLPKAQIALDSVATISDDLAHNAKVGYRHQLASYLKLYLELPEVGDVDMELTLNRQGQVVQVTHVTSQSDTNRAYIQRMVPTLIFPPFDDSVGKELQQTFFIHFQNDR